MLKIPTYIKESKIAGFGLFAAEFIPKGTLIWQLNLIVDKIINEHNLIHLDDLERKFVDTYGYKVGNDIILCSDNGKYINHSKNPNTIDYIDKILGSITIAARDIQKDEEIVSNYESFDDDFKSYEFLYDNKS